MFEDSDHCGLSVAVAIEQTVAKVTCLMMEDLRITENEIKGNFNLSSGNLNRLLHRHLGIWKRCARWVPQQLRTEEGYGVVPSHASKM